MVDDEEQTRTYLPTSLRPDVDSITLEDGRRPVAIPDDEAYRAEIRQASDGTLYVAQLPTDPTVYPTELRDLNHAEKPVGLLIDEYTAAQLALARVLLGLRWYTLGREALVNGGTLKSSSRAYQLSHVWLDWPSHGSEARGQTRALITEASPTIYSSRDLGSEYHEDTRDLFLPNTVVRVYGTATCRLLVRVVFAHKDERAGFRGALVRALLGDPARDEGGRRIIVHEYLRSMVRLDLDEEVGVSYPDTEDSATSGAFELQAQVLAEVDVLGLVPDQELLDPAGLTVVE